ncbi:MAG: M20 family metallopeptidase [Pigmentiphaga sp.]|nr:M20 family metallopeptidase [Pigmentiphaga sp.]
MTACQSASAAMPGRALQSEPLLEPAAATVDGRTPLAAAPALSEPTVRPPVLAAVAEKREFAALRRDLHAHPELGFAEHRTAAEVARRLASWGYAVSTGIGGTGVVGTLRRGSGARSIGLRADMDALPMQEANSFAHRSRHHGRMHACGHDGHTTILLAAAWYLARHGRFEGTLHCIFQPAEEGGQAGARAMIEDGLFTRFPCDRVFALHNWPGQPVGWWGVRSGPFMASSNRFEILVQGKGGHASRPDWAVDPLPAAAQILLGLQTVMSRDRPPEDAAVLSVTQIHGGDAVNVIPDQARLAGTVRTHESATLDLIENRMRTIVEGIGIAHGCEARLIFERNYPALVNDSDATQAVVRILTSLDGAQQVDSAAPRLMNSEDFAFMLEAVPGAYVLLGNGDGSHRDAGHGLGPCMVHNPSYDFNDALLPLGAEYFVALVEDQLPAA